MPRPSEPLRPSEFELSPLAAVAACFALGIAVTRPGPAKLPGVPLLLGCSGCLLLGLIALRRGKRTLSFLLALGGFIAAGAIAAQLFEFRFPAKGLTFRGLCASKASWCQHRSTSIRSSVRPRGAPARERRTIPARERTSPTSVEHYRGFRGCREPGLASSSVWRFRASAGPAPEASGLPKPRRLQFPPLDGVHRKPLLGRNNQDTAPDGKIACHRLLPNLNFPGEHPSAPASGD